MVCDVQQAKQLARLAICLAQRVARDVVVVISQPIQPDAELETH